MKSVNRIFALLLAAALLLSLAACGNSAGSAASAEVAASSAEEVAQEEAPAEAEEAAEPEAPAEAEPSAEEPVSAEEPEEPAEEPEEPAVVIEYPLFDTPQTYSIWMGSAPNLADVISEMNQFVLFRELETITNVTWDATMVSFMAESEQFQLMVASGDYTDVCVKAESNYSGTIDQAIEEDFLIDISPYLEENAPNLTAWMEKYPELRTAMTSEGGAIGGFPKMYADYSDIGSGGMIRQDWLDDLGLESPASYDDFYNTLIAFRDEKGASAPLIIAQANGVQSDLVNGYGISSGFYQVDGEVRYGVIQPEFKDYLTMMNQWYSEGLINDLFLSQGDYQNLQDTSAITTGTAGIWYGLAGQDMTNLKEACVDENASLNGIGYPTVDGSLSHLGEVGALFDSDMWSITTACEDPEVICQYIDYVYSDAGMLLANYGVEGETFEYDENGTPVLTDLVLNNPDYPYATALNIFCCDRMTPAPFVIDEARTRADYTEEQVSAIEIWSNATDGLYNIPSTGVNMTVDESEEYNSIYSDIETYMDENVVKFIVGDKSLDEFDAFVDTLKQMGIEDCIAIEQAAYDRYLENA